MNKHKSLKYILALTSSFNLNAGIIINEFQPNPTGTDKSKQSIELLGEPNTSFEQLTLLSIEADTNNNIGSIDSLTADMSGTFDSNGLSTFEIKDLENPSFILVLMEGEIFDQSSDLDSDNDGFFDSVNWFGTVLDSIAIFDSVGDYNSGKNYAAQLGGVSFSYTGDEPQLVFRDSINKNVYSINDPVGDIVYGEHLEEYSLSSFSTDPTMTTFGNANPYRVSRVPEVSSMVLFILFCMIYLSKRAVKRDE